MHSDIGLGGAVPARRALVVTDGFRNSVTIAL